MVSFFKKIIFIVILIVFSISSLSGTFASNSEKNWYIYINDNTSEKNIKDFQKFFKALKIYKWNIDGKYSSIKPEIIKFQVKNKIVSTKNSNWAGYIWPKTYKYFDNKYWNKFKKAYLKFFKIKNDNIKNENCFIVSAYYSPLPNQKKYLTKSYKWDIKLNWNWTHWASWAKVYPWFIAAPSNYPFWTKIKLEWLWIWTVEDRGWAIVRKWVRWYKCDRLDIWMWYGDEWLNRALKWWKKKVIWKIVNKNSKNTITFPTEYREYLAIKIKPESKKSDLEKMQKLFSQASLYSWKIDWKYSSFKDEIIDFQVKNHIIKNKNDYAAGYIWAKTIKKLEEIYPSVFVLIRKEDIKYLWTENKENIKLENKKIIIKNHSKIYLLSDEEKNKLNKIVKIINKSILKKSWNNKNKLRKLKIEMKKKLIVEMNKTKSNKKKKKLNYLINKI